VQKQKFIFIWILAICLVFICLEAGCRESSLAGNVSKQDTITILSEREQAEFIEKDLRWKKENFLPALLKENDVDMWIVTEEDEDIFLFLIPAFEDGLIRRFPYYMVFSLNESGIEQIPLGNQDDIEEWGPLFPGHIFSPEESLEKLAQIVNAKNPGKIAIGRGRNPELEKALGSYAGRLTSADDIRHRWLEYRTPIQIKTYETIVKLTHEILAEAFSNAVITPDVSTTTDVDWWVKQKVADMGLAPVFGPTVMVWRSIEENKKYGDPEEFFNINIPPYCGNNTVIRRGDVLSCDFGIQYMGIETDIQQVGYILKEGETDVPAGLKEAIGRANRLQDILAGEFQEGRTGNQILFAALEKAKAENLRPEIYCHPMGVYYYRYGIKGGIFPKRSADWGPSIGSEGYFDEEGNQRPTRRGEIVLSTNTAYAMELDITHAIPEWDGQDLRIVLEEKVVYTQDGLIFPGGRQTEYHVIK